MSVKTTVGSGAAVTYTGLLPYTGVSSAALVGLTAAGAGLVAAGVLLHYWASKR